MFLKINKEKSLTLNVLLLLFQQSITLWKRVCFVAYYLKIVGAKSVVLMSHLGRPDGQYNAKLTLAPVAETLKELLKRYTSTLYIRFIRKGCHLPERLRWF